MNYINKITGEYPVTETAIRLANPNTSFASPFVAPEEYVVVFAAPAPDHDPIKEMVREVAPVLTEKGHYEQQWEVFELEPEQVDGNIEAAKGHLTEAVTSKRWGVMTGGMTVGEMQIGTSIDDQNRIASVVAIAEIVGLTDESLVDFKANSGWVQISIGQIKAIAGVIGQFVQACYTAERTHHEAIEMLSTPAEINAYDVNAGWPT